METKVSFVECKSKLKVITDAEELEMLMKQCRENNKPLQNLDLSGVEMKNTIGPYDKFSDVVGDALSSVQTTAGILLIGFAGFVLANRVRSNY